MKILFFTQSGTQGASSRYRVHQFLPFLREKGWDCRLAPAVPSALHETYFFSRNTAWKALLSLVIFLRRLVQLCRIPFADVVFVQKPLLPAGWPPLEPLAALFAKKLVFDCDDAIFLPSPFRKGRRTPGNLAERFRKIAASADLVLAGNAFLAEEAARCAPRVEIFPTVVDTGRFAVNGRPERASCVIGWMGSPSTAVYLQGFKDVMAELSQQFSARWVFVGAPVMAWDGIPGTFEDWAYATEVEKMQSFDIFISPLENTPWEEGKCGLKTLTAMSAGLPVVASAVGVHKDIVKDGVNGFLASTPEEWKEKLSLLVSDAGLRRKLGDEARKTVQRDFDLAQAAHRLAALLQGL